MADARQKRDEARSLIAKDEDPSIARKDPKAKVAAEQTETFTKIASELLAKKRIEGRAEATLTKTEWFHRLLGADIGHMPISQITARDVLVPLKKIENSRTLACESERCRSAPQIYSNSDSNIVFVRT
nr:hypothetical protein [Thalassovita autumnalis]